MYEIPSRHFNILNPLYHKIKGLGTKTVTNSSKKMRNLINNKNDNIPKKSKSRVYEIPCLDCYKNM